MFEVVQNIKELGAYSLDSFWFPVLIWTICSTIAFLALRVKKNINPLFHYHLRTAAIFSLFMGIMASFLLKLIPQLVSAPEFETAFLVMNNPIEIVREGYSASQGQEILWQDPSFFIGMISILAMLISAFMLLRFIA